jgi:hypothetical protein
MTLLSRMTVVLSGLSLVLSALAGPAGAGTGDPALINEVLSWHSGPSENSEFIELYGVPDTSLHGLSIIIVRGGSVWLAGRVVFRYDFGPTDALGPNGFYLLGGAVGLQDNYQVIPDIDFGPGLDHIMDIAITVALVETSSLLSEVGEEITYYEIVRDAVGIDDPEPGSMFYYYAPVVGPDGTHLAAGARRRQDGVDTNTRADWVMASYELPGQNTPTCSGPPLAAEPATWGRVKVMWR